MKLIDDGDFKNVSSLKIKCVGQRVWRFRCATTQRCQQTHSGSLHCQFKLLHVDCLWETELTAPNQTPDVRSLQDILSPSWLDRSGYPDQHHHKILHLTEPLRAGSQLHQQNYLPWVRQQQPVCALPLLCWPHQRCPTWVRKGSGKSYQRAEESSRSRRHWIQGLSLKATCHRWTADGWDSLKSHLYQWKVPKTLGCLLQDCQLRQARWNGKVQESAGHPSWFVCCRQELGSCSKT